MKNLSVWISFLCLVPTDAIAVSQNTLSSLEISSLGGAPLEVAPASPDCWLNTLQETTSKTHLEIDTCTYLDTRQQQVLSLKLTQCHLESMGRSIMIDDVGGSCSNIDTKNVAECLPQINDIAATTYTLFFKDLHQVCSTLLQDNFANQYFATSQELAKISKLAEGRLQSMLEQQDLIIQAWDEREVQLSSLIQQQTSFAANQTLELQAKMELFHRQELKKYRQELQGLSHTVQKTRQSIKPWAQGVDFLMTHAGTTYSILRTLLTSSGTVILLLILTFPKCLHWMRFRLISAVFLAIVAEIILLLFDDGEILSLPEEMELSGGIEDYLFNFLVTGYIGGVIFSIISSCGYQAEEEEKSPNFLDRQDELLQRLEQYDQRWRDMVSQQQQQQQQQQQHNQQKASPNEIKRLIQHYPSIVGFPVNQQLFGKSSVQTLPVPVPPIFRSHPSPNLIPHTPMTWNLQVPEARHPEIVPNGITAPEPITPPPVPQTLPSSGHLPVEEPEWNRQVLHEDIDGPPQDDGVESDQESRNDSNDKKRSAIELGENIDQPNSKRQRSE
jgi:hypothetical protein